MSSNFKQDNYEISVTEAQRSGVSKICRTAEDKGMLVLKSFDTPRALVLPLTLKGRRKFFDLLSQIASIDDVDEDFKNYVHDMMNFYKLKGLNE